MQESRTSRVHVGDVLASLLSMSVAASGRVARRNPGTILLMILLVPWGYFLWQLYAHFGHIAVSPFAMLRTRGLAPVQAPTTPAPVLLVTALFPSASSAISYHDTKWLENLFGRVTTEIYVYAPPALEHLVRELRGNLPILLNTSFHSVHSIPILASFIPEDYTLSRAEALRLTKPWLVSAALDHISSTSADSDRERYRYAFWLDAHTLSERHTFSDWPSPARVDAIWSSGAQAVTKDSPQSSEDVIFVPLTRLPPAPLRDWNRARGPVSIHNLNDRDASDDPLFGGTVNAVHWFASAFYDLLEEYIAEGHHVHSGGDITNALILLHPLRFITVWNGDHASRSSSPIDGLGECGSPWYYFLWWLAAEAEREEMNALWSSSQWRWDFWRENAMCQMAQVSPVLNVLRAAFGPDWTPPLEIDDAFYE